MEFAASLSQHPLATQAVGEVVGDTLERLGGPPDLVMLFMSPHHIGVAEDVIAAIRRMLNPRVLVGASAGAVIGGALEVEDGPAISLWAARLGVDIDPVRLTTVDADGALLVTGGESLAGRSGHLLLIADPFSFPIEPVVTQLGHDTPDIVVLGGLASAATAPGGNLLALDDERFRDGAVGVLIPDGVPIRPVVSQGCRPIGDAYVVTSSQGNIVRELGGRPALERIEAMIDAADDDTKRLLAGGLHVGVAINEQSVELTSGDFLVRGVIGADRANGAVAIGCDAPVGTTLQLQVRDARSASNELHRLLDDCGGEAALVFSCNGRGSLLFDEAGHDATAFVDAVGPAVGGMFCAGELGPVAGRNAVHGVTACGAIFGNFAS